MTVCFCRKSSLNFDVGCSTATLKFCRGHEAGPQAQPPWLGPELFSFPAHTLQELPVWPLSLLGSSPPPSMGQHMAPRPTTQLSMIDFSVPLVSFLSHLPLVLAAAPLIHIRCFQHSSRISIQATALPQNALFSTWIKVQYQLSRCNMNPTI